MEYKDLKPVDNKFCPSCGTKFTCTGEDDCWCESYNILHKEMYLLMQTYQDCLCPKCLKTYETE